MRRMLMEVQADGGIIVLDDESRWEVNPGDMPTACTWMPTAALEIRTSKSTDMYSYRVTNREIDVSVWARPLTQGT